MDINDLMGKCGSCPHKKHQLPLLEIRNCGLNEEARMLLLVLGPRLKRLVAIEREKTYTPPENKLKKKTLEASPVALPAW